MVIICFKSNHHNHSDAPLKPMLSQSLFLLLLVQSICDGKSLVLVTSNGLEEGSGLAFTDLDELELGATSAKLEDEYVTTDYITENSEVENIDETTADDDITENKGNIVTTNTVTNDNSTTINIDTDDAAKTVLFGTMVKFITATLHVSVSRNNSTSVAVSHGEKITTVHHKI